MRRVVSGLMAQSTSRVTLPHPTPEVRKTWPPTLAVPRVSGSVVQPSAGPTAATAMAAASVERNRLSSTPGVACGAANAPASCKGIKYEFAAKPRRTQ